MRELEDVWGSVEARGLRMEVRRVTPETARLWRQWNDNNRNLMESVVARYLRDMTAGVWLLTGDPIRWAGDPFAENGDGDARLIDGQHRLAACERSGVAFDSVVIYGFAGAVQDVLDSGAIRRLPHHLTRLGEKSVSLLAASIVFCWRYQRGAVRDTSVQPTIQESLAWLEANTGVRASIHVGHMLKKRNVGITPSVAVAFHHLLSLINPDDADAFFEQLGSGAGLEEGSPILALRRWLERTAAKRDKPRRETVAAITVKAINAYRRGDSVKLLHYRPGGAAAEPFPRILDDSDVE